MGVRWAYDDLVHIRSLARYDRDGGVLETIAPARCAQIRTAR